MNEHQKEMRERSKREFERLYKAWRNDPESSDAFWDLAAFLAMWPAEFGPI